VLDHQYRGGSRAFERYAPISSALRFAPEGLVLGAGTVLLRADGPRRLRSPKGCEARLLALLSAAYGRAVDLAVLGNIERAAKAWNGGDDCLAYIHLAHARLGELPYPHDAAQRLVIVDAFLKAGGSPRAVFKALKLDAAYIDALEKEYNPAELRVPLGSGKPSGEWTRGREPAKPPVPSFAPTPGAASWLDTLTPPAVISLGRYAASVLTAAGGAAAVFGLLFVPSPNNIHVEGEVQGVPGLRYSWNRDETVLHLTYGLGGEAPRTFAFNVDGDVIRNEDGHVVGRIIGGNRIVIDTVAVLPDLVKQDEPRLCPAYAPDVPGSDQGKEYEDNRARQYEDFVKRLINPPPDAPTPSGYVYYLPNPANDGKPVSFDDCEKPTGILFEIKGEGIAKLTDDLPDVMEQRFVKQATAQMAASGGRPVVWIFAEEKAALFAREVFDRTDGLKGITVAYVPWTR
jgi:hypothetical protein